MLISCPGCCLLRASAICSRHSSTTLSRVTPLMSIGGGPIPSTYSSTTARRFLPLLGLSLYRKTSTYLSSIAFRCNFSRHLLATSGSLNWTRANPDGRPSRFNISWIPAAPAISTANSPRNVYTSSAVALKGRPLSWIAHCSDGSSSTHSNAGPPPRYPEPPSNPSPIGCTPSLTTACSSSSATFNCCSRSSMVIVGSSANSSPAGGGGVGKLATTSAGSAEAPKMRVTLSCPGWPVTENTPGYR
mmetsp:Transcript_13371/g.31351  ORF Transcript_13371/g.31351 Transcript_13371/m.31351 type:complete len:245 (+) Transcript_13371:1685-2419(+)